MPKRPKPWWRKDRGAWFVQINGRRHNLGRDKKQAYHRYHELMAQPQRRRLSGDSLVAIIDEFLDYCDRNRAPETYEWYRSRLQELVKTLPVGLSAAHLLPHHITRWVDSHSDWSDGSKRNAHRSIQRAMSWAAEQSLIDRNPIAHLKKPRGGKRDQIVSPAEFEEILSLVPDRAFRDLLITTWETGCRPQESLRVEARHVDLTNSRWVFQQTEGKTGVPRAVYLTEKALQITCRLMNQHPEGILFRNSRGAPWTTDAVNCAFIRVQLRMGKSVMKREDISIDQDQFQEATKGLRTTRCLNGRIVCKTKAELLEEARRKLTHRLATSHAPKYSLYALRHSWATHALERGIDSLTVAILMGHQDPSTLARVYQHLSHNPKHLLEQARKAVG